MSGVRQAASVAGTLLVLVAARLAGLDALAVWAAAVLLIGLPGLALVWLARLEGALGRAGSAPAAATLGLALWAPPLGAGFILNRPYEEVLVAAGVLAALAVGAAALRRHPRLPAARRPEVALGALAALVFAYGAWRLSTGIVGDALFHVGRMRKLLGADALSLHTISSFRSGPPNAGYTFPLLHAAFAGVSRVAGVDPGTAFVYLQPACALVAILAAYALGARLGGERLAGWLAAALTAWDLSTLINGLLPQINQPPPFAFWVVTPAALLLFLASADGVRTAGPAALLSVCVLVAVHPTYAIPSLVIGAGILAGAWRAGAPAIRPALEALLAAVAVTGLVSLAIYLGAIRGGERHRALSHPDEFLVHGDRALLMYPWAPVFGRGYVLLAVLLVALLARHRRTLPLAGGLVALLLFLLLPGVNTVVIAAVGMGQFHRFWQVLPWPAALGAAAVLLAGLVPRPLLVCACAALAVALDLARGDPGFWREPTSWLVAAGLALAVLSLLRRPAAGWRVGPGWAAAMVVAAALAGPLVYGLDQVTDEARAGPYRPARPDLVVRVTPGVVRYFRRVPGIPVVLGPPDRVFELIGKANVYAQALPEARTRAEPRLDDAARLHDEQAFFSPETRPAERTAVLARWNVDYVLLDLRGQPPDVTGAVLADPRLQPVYRDRVGVPAELGRFVILRVRSATTDRSPGGSATGTSTP